VATPADTIPSLAIERLTFGADALAHHDGEVVFVPFAAPGDTIEARVRARERGYLRAEVARLLRPGPDRVAPACAAFGRCGGCQWQHVALAAQRDAKRAIVAEQLARIAGLRDVDVRPTLADAAGLGHRARITLVAEGRRLGYHRARSHVLEEIGACPIASAAVATHLDVARAWMAALRTAAERVTIAEAPGGVVLVAALRRPPTPTDVEATESLLAAHASVRGAVLGHRTARRTVGDPDVTVEVEPGLVLEAPADAFAQVNPAANRLLVASALALADVAAGARVLDLYCGAGNFTLPLARRGADVTGIERDALAVEAGRANAARLGLGARFVAGDVAAALATIDGPVDAIVLDPPRAGAADALPALVALRPSRIVYVSCDPATLARDCRTLAAHGYGLRAVQPVDVFPQTFHVEAVALLGLT
jgi:23S rRNA (uracil1939-C5)-methyltransferase